MCWMSQLSVVSAISTLKSPTSMNGAFLYFVSYSINAVSMNDLTFPTTRLGARFGDAAVPLRLPTLVRPD
ncbi:unnamed protein product, partial [Ixodes hexagonus]